MAPLSGPSFEDWKDPSHGWHRVTPGVIRFPYHPYRLDLITKWTQVYYAFSSHPSIQSVLASTFSKASWQHLGNTNLSLSTKGFGAGSALDAEETFGNQLNRVRHKLRNRTHAPATASWRDRAIHSATTISHPDRLLHHPCVPQRTGSHSKCSTSL